MKKSSFVFFTTLFCLCFSSGVTSEANKSAAQNSSADRPSHTITSQNVSVESENEWISLKPSKFDNLPKDIIEHLQSLNCEIPQSYFSEKPHNVIQGEFFTKGQKDWAVLCFRNNNIDDSILFAYPNASSKNVVEVTHGSDSGYFQNFDGKGTMGFSRAVGTAKKQYIIDRNPEIAKKTSLILDHDGIEDAFVEKASTVLYFHRGKWLELQGAD